MNSYKINEIYGPVIQGEGRWTGHPVLFLRFAGCNKRCSFCDTNYHPFEEMSKEVIVGKLNALNAQTRVIVISGGEPLMQLDEELAIYLKGAGFILHIETNGTYELKGLRSLITHVSCSPKQSVDKTIIEHVDDLKIIYPLMNSSSWVDYKMKYPFATCSIQPVDDLNYDKNLAEAIELVQGSHNLKLSLQIHKMIGVK